MDENNKRCFEFDNDSSDITDTETHVEPENPDEPEQPEPPIKEPPENNDPVEDEPEEDEECVFQQWIYQNIPDFYDRVRQNLGTGNLLSDTMIDYFENAPMSEIKIKQRVENWEELDELKMLMFEACIVYMTCYTLCPYARSMRISRQKDPSLEIEFASNAGNENPCDRFLELIDDLIAQINEEELSAAIGFKVTKGSIDCKCVKPYCFHKKKRNAFEPL